MRGGTTAAQRVAHLLVLAGLALAAYLALTLFDHAAHAADSPSASLSDADAPATAQKLVRNATNSHPSSATTPDTAATKAKAPARVRKTATHPKNTAVRPKSTESR